MRPWLLLGLLLGFLWAVAWGRPTAVTGPAFTEGPARVSGGTTTTTTLPVGSQNWCPSMLACWMLDEASGTRTNAQGTTSRNLTESGGTTANDTTNKMEGTAAALLVANIWLQTTDATLKAIPAPFTCGLWARKTASNSMIVFGAYNGTVNGWQVWHNSDTNWQFQMFGGGNNIYFTPGNAANTWTHVAVRYGGGASGTTLQSYKDGLPRTTAEGPYIVSTGTVFQVGSGSYAGQIDELWCAGSVLSDAAICRICSCGVRGEQCTCTGSSFATTGRNASACSSCTLPALCNAPTPP